MLSEAKILDVYASQTQIVKEKQENADENSEDDDSDDDDSEEEGSSQEGSGEKEFDENDNLDPDAIKNSLEYLKELDEVDVCLNCSKGNSNYGTDYEKLNDVEDEILMGHEEEVLRKFLMNGDANFSIKDMQEEEIPHELSNVVKKAIFELNKKYLKMQKLKKHFKRKCMNGNSFCGIKVQTAISKDGSETSVLPRTSTEPRTFMND